VIERLPLFRREPVFYPRAITRRKRIVSTFCFSFDLAVGRKRSVAFHSKRSRFLRIIEVATLSLSPAYASPFRFGSKVCHPKVWVSRFFGLPLHYRNLQHGFLSPSTHGHVIELPAFSRANLSILSASVCVRLYELHTGEPRHLQSISRSHLDDAVTARSGYSPVFEKRSTFESSPHVESFETPRSKHMCFLGPEAFAAWAGISR
jgi:hypothetical protein